MYELLYIKFKLLKIKFRALTCNALTFFYNEQSNKNSKFKTLQLNIKALYRMLLHCRERFNFHT